MSTHLAIDIGGSHGRAVLGVYQEGRWTNTEIGTFSTSPIEQNGVLFWDVFKMFSGIRSLIFRAAYMTEHLDTVAIDSMGLAFALLDSKGELVTQPVYTRIPQEESLRKEILSNFGEDKLYSITGLEQEKLNSLYFLADIKRNNPDYLAKTRHFLMLPDLFNYWLTGIIHNEYTIATTSNLWDINQMCWSTEIIEYVGICPEAFGPIYHCGQIVGRLKKDFTDFPALKDTLVVHAASHDTASACYSFQSGGEPQAFISAGTWGMTGCILDQPILTNKARIEKFANEGAGAKQVKLLNNAPCMSVLEACVKHWHREENIPWREIYSELEGERMSKSIIDLYHPYFRQQDNMPEKVKQYCSENSLPVPQTKREVSKAVISSIAHHFGVKYKALKEITGLEFSSVILLGGAARSKVFVDFCAQCVDAPIVVGDPESSSKGNLCAQKNALDKNTEILGDSN